MPSRSLTVTRKECEALILRIKDSSGEMIEIVQTINYIEGKSAKINTKAPEEVKILREELI